MSFEIKGLKEIQDKLKEVSENAKALDGHAIPVTEALTDTFIQENSSFNNLNDLIKASGFAIQSQADLKAIPSNVWNEFISKNTKFQSWQEMINSAATIYAKNKLGL